MADDTDREATRAAQARAAGLDAYLPNLPPRSVDTSLSSAIAQSRRLIKESYRILAESRKSEPPGE